MVAHDIDDRAGIPIAASAVMSGSSAPGNDRRKAKNRTTDARMMPRRKLEDVPLCSLFSIAAPPSSTSTRELSTDWAVEIRLVTADFGTFAARASKVTVANPIVPSGLICPTVRYGEVTERTWAAGPPWRTGS